MPHLAVTDVHTYTITDNEDTPTIDFNTTSSSGAESVSSKALTVDLSAASSQDVTVDYAVTGTATGSGTDYTLAMEPSQLVQDQHQVLLQSLALLMTHLMKIMRRSLLPYQVQVMQA